jgi:hypothetical protein
MKIVSICMLMVLFLACNNKNNQNKIGEKQMQTIIKDMVTAEVFVTNYLVKDSIQHLKKEVIKYYDTIFAIHKVTKAQFKESLHMYMQNPNQFKVMLDSIQVDARKFNNLEQKLKVI